MDRYRKKGTPYTGLIMEKPNNYDVYRDRLLRKGILNKRQGYIGLTLPYFGDYITEYNK